MKWREVFEGLFRPTAGEDPAMMQPSEAAPRKLRH